jgi:four helix bundle protein
VQAATAIVHVKKDLQDRTLYFALSVVKLYIEVKRTEAGNVLGKQLLRAGTSVGAQYSEAQHAKSRADFLSKIGGVRQELEETIYWLKLMSLAEIAPRDRITPLQQEAAELKAIFLTISERAKTSSGWNNA